MRKLRAAVNLKHIVFKCLDQDYPQQEVVSVALSVLEVLPPFHL